MSLRHERVPGDHLAQYCALQTGLAWVKVPAYSMRLQCAGASAATAAAAAAATAAAAAAAVIRDSAGAGARD